MNELGSFIPCFSLGIYYSNLRNNKAIRSTTINQIQYAYNLKSPLVMILPREEGTYISTNYQSNLVLFRIFLLDFRLNKSSSCSPTSSRRCLFFLSCFLAASCFSASNH